MSGAPAVVSPSARLEAIVAYLDAPRQLALRRETIEPDKLGATQVLCETLVTAISPGTELAAYQGLPALRAGVGYPRLQGYCNVARVLSAGSAVRNVQPGDRVLSYTSHRSHFVLESAEVLLKLAPQAVSEEIVCTYLYQLGYNAVLRSGVRAGSRVLVIGLGVLGLTTVAMASLAGASVVALSDHEFPRQLAMEFGAAAAFSRSQSVELRASLTKQLAQVVVTTSNSWDDWMCALQSAAHFATIACLGFPGRGQPPCPFNPLEPQHFYARQLRIESVGMSPPAESRGQQAFDERDSLAALATLIAEKRLRPAKLVSGIHAGTQIEQAYQELMSRKGSPITYVLRWNPE